MNDKRNTKEIKAKEKGKSWTLVRMQNTKEI